METGIKKLLVISWCMPPLVYPRSIQVARTLMALNQMGWQITVLCSEAQSATADDILDDKLAQVYADNYTRVSVAQSSGIPHSVFNLSHRRALRASEISHMKGHCYQISLPRISLPEKFNKWLWVLNDSMDYPHAAQTVIFEDERPLGPMHSKHDDIARLGKGRFSHWGDFLYFSTSDNSDPLVNGRSYQVMYSVAPSIQQNEIQWKSEIEYDLKWRCPAVEAARKMLKHVSPSAIITFAQPWVDHLVGLELKRKTRLPWLAHFSDPWVDNLYHASMGEKTLAVWRRLEEDVVREADAVIFTNQHARDLVMRKYQSKWKKKTWIIPHGYDPQLGKIMASEPARGQRLRLVYTGTLYKERSIRSLFEALSIMEQTSSEHGQIELVVAGPADAAFSQMISQMGLNGVVTFLGRLPYIDSLRVASGADVLVVIEAPNPEPNPFLPSKLVDYLMFNKPILALSPPAGATADLLRQLSYPVVPPDNLAMIRCALVDIVVRRREGRLHPSEKHSEIASHYDVHKTTITFNDILMKATCKPASGHEFLRSITRMLPGIKRR